MDIPSLPGWILPSRAGCYLKEMLLRPDGDDFIAIGQPAHAWLSGQLARAWAEPFEPWEEVCLAAEQHDVGMAAWDGSPKLNPDTGLPRSFMELELEDHLEIWWRAAPIVLQQSRYAALLVSMHGTALYARRDLDDERVSAFLAGQAELQAGLLETLRADPRTARFATDEIVRRNQQLVWRWDSLSLGLLLGWDLELDPWPFRDDPLSVRCEGRRLTGRFDDEEAMRHALADAPWVTLDIRVASTS
jgi:Protein of unknown function (DUF3891)